jgi:thioredoxin-like negative regulator of GroEL
MAPVFERLAKHYRKRMEFVAVNASDRPDIARRFGVQSVPTFILVNRGRALQRFQGNIPEAVLKSYLDPYVPAPTADANADEEDGGLLAKIRGLFGRN